MIHDIAYPDSDESQQPRCAACGYLLIGLPAKRCPECGRGFDLADRRTFAAGVETTTTAYATLAEALLLSALSACLVLLGPRDSGSQVYFMPLAAMVLFDAALVCAVVNHRSWLTPAIFLVVAGTMWSVLCSRLIVSYGPVFWIGMAGAFAGGALLFTVKISMRGWNEGL
jgi:hypothetical protein